MKSLNSLVRYCYCPVLSTRHGATEFLSVFLSYLGFQQHLHDSAMEGVFLYALLLIADVCSSVFGVRLSVRRKKFLGFPVLVSVLGRSYVPKSQGQDFFPKFLILSNSKHPLLPSWYRVWNTTGFPVSSQGQRNTVWQQCRVLGKWISCLYSFCNSSRWLLPAVSEVCRTGGFCALPSLAGGFYL